jgi:DNA-binding NarL/FixJ family response regulator
MLTNKVVGKTKVIVSDDHPTLRRGIIALLKVFASDFEVVGEADSGYQTLMLCHEKTPDILILDLTLAGDMSGFDVIHVIRQQKLPVKIVVITATKYARDAAVKEMEAEAYLLKRFTDEEIITTLKEVANTDTGNKQYPLIPNNNFAIEILTSRELEYLQLAAKGFSQKEIAEQLSIDRGSVAATFNKIYGKLQVKNSAEAIAFGFRNKLLS